MFTLKCLAEAANDSTSTPDSVGRAAPRWEGILPRVYARDLADELGCVFHRVVRDIRERKEAERALSESREHYIKLFNEARAMEEDLRQLSNKVLTVQEEERKHISRELHDEIGQALTAVNVSIAQLRSHVAGDEAFRKKVDAAQQLLEQCMEHRAPICARAAAVDAGSSRAGRGVAELRQVLYRRTGIQTDWREREARAAQQPAGHGALPRRTGEPHERVQTCQGHAGQIRLRQLPRAVCMEIVDNGRAFPPSECPE